MEIRITTISFILSAAVFLAPVSMGTVFAATATSTTKLQERINALEGRVAELNVKLDPTQGITHTLRRKSTGNDVKLLQKFLKVYGVYPEGLVTGYFGVLTERAVKKFQEKESVDPVGIVGPKTRMRIIKVSQQKTEKNLVAPAVPEITDAILTDHVAENGAAVVSTTSFASTTENIYAVLSLKNAVQDTKISYIRSYRSTYIDSEVSHPSRNGLRYFHFQWSLKPNTSRTVGDYSLVLYINGKKSKTIHYTIH